MLVFKRSYVIVSSTASGKFAGGEGGIAIIVGRDEPSSLALPRRPAATHRECGARQRLIPSKWRDALQLSVTPWRVSLGALLRARA
jgi:hypothetical protein